MADSVKKMFRIALNTKDSFVYRTPLTFILVLIKNNKFQSLTDSHFVLRLREVKKYSSNSSLNTECLCVYRVPLALIIVQVKNHQFDILINRHFVSRWRTEEDNNVKRSSEYLLLPNLLLFLVDYPPRRIRYLTLQRKHSLAHHLWKRKKPHCRMCGGRIVYLLCRYRFVRAEVFHSSESDKRCNYRWNYTQNPNIAISRHYIPV